MFHCPTASSPDRNENYAGYSRSDYVAVAGSVLSDALDASSNGVFAMNSGTRFDDIVDGTQFTLLVGERSMTLEGTHGAIWMRSINRAGNRGDGLAVTGICGRDVRLNDVTQRSGFLGRHLGGVLFAMADGAVRFISEGIESDTYEHLAQIYDGNALTESSIIRAER